MNTLNVVKLEECKSLKFNSSSGHTPQSIQRPYLQRLIAKLPTVQNKSVCKYDRLMGKAHPATIQREVTDITARAEFYRANHHYSQSYKQYWLQCSNRSYVSGPPLVSSKYTHVSGTTKQFPSSPGFSTSLAHNHESDSCQDTGLLTPFPRQQVGKGSDIKCVMLYDSRMEVHKLTCLTGGLVGSSMGAS